MSKKIITNKFDYNEYSSFKTNCNLFNIATMHTNSNK